MACDGPDGTRWSNTLQTCVSVAGGSSCDQATGSTCWYGYLDLIGGNGGSKAASKVPGWFSGKFEEEGFRIYNPRALEGLCALNRGDLVHRINGRKPSERILRGYPEERPARFAELRRNSKGEVNLILKH